MDPEERMDPRELIGMIAFFSEALNGDEIFALASGAERRTFDAGQALLSEGDPGESMFVIESGQVESIVEALQVQQREAEIGMNIRRGRIERGRAPQNSARFLVAPAVEDGHAEKMHGVETVGPLLEHLPAKRLHLRMPALAIGGERDQHRFEQLPQLLRLLLVWCGVGAGGALQRGCS